MKRLKITTSMLGRIGACAEQIEAFSKAFPRGIQATDDQEVNFPIVVAAMESGLDVFWFLEAVAGDPYDDLLDMCKCTACSELREREPMRATSCVEDPAALFAGALADLVGMVHVDHAELRFDKRLLLKGRRA